MGEDRRRCWWWDVQDELPDREHTVPHSPQNTYVFAIFEAKDTTTNLHVALDRFQGDIDALNGTQWK